MATVPTFADGTVPHQASFQFLTTPPSLYCYQNTAQAALANTTTTVITFDTNVYDTDSSGATHSTTVNTSRVVPLTAGYHLVTATICWASNVTGHRQCEIRKNAAGSGAGGTRIAFGAEQAISVAGAVSFTQITTIVQFNGTTDYIELFGYQSSGGTLSVAAAASTGGYIGSVGIQTRWINS